MKNAVAEAQSSLFDEVQPILTPSQPRAGKHHHDPNRNELAGALSIVPKSGTARERVLRALVEKGGKRGLIDWEISRLAGIPLSSVTGRRNELMEPSRGFVEDSGRQARGPYGQPNTLWVATERGRRAHERGIKAAGS